jgi:hypothetical protein
LPQQLPQNLKDKYPIELCTLQPYWSQELKSGSSKAAQLKEQLNGRIPGFQNVVYRSSKAAQHRTIKWKNTRLFKMSFNEFVEDAQHRTIKWKNTRLFEMSFNKVRPPTYVLYIPSTSEFQG